MKDEGVATSGTYIRGLHIYNPRGGNEPVSDIVSLTVIGPNIHDADRFATAAFAMGAAGINFIEQLPGYEGYIIDKDKDRHHDHRIRKIYQQRAIAQRGTHHNELH